MAATTITHSTGVNLTTDVAFRAWGSAISAAITTAGWTQTADTGQVNWTTITVPTAGTAPATIYEVWRLADTLQATDPVFIKVMYSRSTSSGPAMRVIAGTASDGAGTITSAANTNTSVTTTFDVFDSGNIGSATSCKSYVNGDGSSLILFLSPNQNSGAVNGGLFALERRRSSSGAAAAGGFTVQFVPGNAQSSGGPKYQCVYTNNFYAQPASSSTRGFVPSGRQATSSSDNGVKQNVVPVYPVLTGAYPELGAPSKYLLAAYRADVPLGQTFTLTHYGSTQTFMSTGSGWLTAASTTFGDAFERFVPMVRID